MVERDITDFVKELRELDTDLIESASVAIKKTDIMGSNAYYTGRSSVYTQISEELHKRFPKVFPEYQQPAEKK
jgi:hypothetical protein